MSVPMPDRRQRAMGLVVGMFVLLALQNAAGIWINLYVVVNDTTSYAGVYPAMFASVAGALHTIIGILMGLNAILLLALVWRMADRRLRGIAAAVLGLVGLASYLGYHFVQSGGDNAYSFGMEMCFLGVVLLEVGLLYLLVQHRDLVPIPPAAPASPTA